MQHNSGIDTYIPYSLYHLEVSQLLPEKHFVYQHISNTSVLRYLYPEKTLEQFEALDDLPEHFYNILAFQTRTPVISKRSVDNQDLKKVKHVL